MSSMQNQARLEQEVKTVWCEWCGRKLKKTEEWVRLPSPPYPYSHERLPDPRYSSFRHVECEREAKLLFAQMYAEQKKN